MRCTGRTPVCHRNGSGSEMARFLKEGDVIAADNGTSLSGVTGMALPAHTHVIGQALWGAVGYSLPATFGSMMAKPDRRHVLFIGDGSFPFTGQELSSILRHPADTHHFPHHQTTVVPSNGSSSERKHPISELSPGDMPLCANCSQQALHLKASVLPRSMSLSTRSRPRIPPKNACSSRC